MNKIVTWGIYFCVILLCLLIVLIDKISFPSTDISDGLITIVSAFVGILITMTVTSTLLNDQSKAESLKERNVKHFEKKQETYHQFLGELSNIIIGLTKRSLSGDKSAAYENIESFEKLIFQFGYLRIHMGEEKFSQVMTKTTEMLDVYHRNELTKKYREDIVENNYRRSEALNHALHELMQCVANNLFEISTILNDDMYYEPVCKGMKNQFSDNIKNLLETTGLKPNGVPLPAAEPNGEVVPVIAASNAETVKLEAMETTPKSRQYSKRRKRKNK
ncbi:MAG: hypothetical protein IKU50_08550 [Bacteroidaceae bacterium]|nr:hypothetical protein [Bacteroidaceae bacterium]